MDEIFNVIKPQNKLEETILSDTLLQDGLLWGQPRNGHPEGKVLLHVGHVLSNVEKFYGGDTDYWKLRLITIIHDSFKYKVDQLKQKSGENHHSRIACRFAEKHCVDVGVLKVIETHDDAYLAFRKGKRSNRWDLAKERVDTLIAELKKVNAVELYVKFFNCDNYVEGKERNSYEWFVEFVTNAS